MLGIFCLPSIPGKKSFTSKIRQLVMKKGGNEGKVLVYRAKNTRSRNSWSFKHYSGLEMPFSFFFFQSLALPAPSFFAHLSVFILPIQRGTAMYIGGFLIKSAQFTNNGGSSAKRLMLNFAVKCKWWDSQFFCQRLLMLQRIESFLISTIPFNFRSERMFLSYVQWLVWSEWGNVNNYWSTALG